MPVHVKYIVEGEKRMLSSVNTNIYELTIAQKQNREKYVFCS